MKIKILMKSPDAVYESVREAVVQGLQKDAEYPAAAPALREIDDRVDDLFAGPLAKWINYREYVSIEIDTEDGTARVCEQS